MFCLCWRSKITGATGQGTMALDRATAQAWLKEAKAKYPELEHWLEEA